MINSCKKHQLSQHEFVHQMLSWFSKEKIFCIGKLTLQRPLDNQHLSL